MLRGSEQNQHPPYPQGFPFAVDSPETASNLLVAWPTLCPLGAHSPTTVCASSLWARMRKLTLVTSQSAAKRCTYASFLVPLPFLENLGSPAAPVPASLCPSSGFLPAVLGHIFPGGGYTHVYSAQWSPKLLLDSGLRVVCKPPDNAISSLPMTLGSVSCLCRLYTPPPCYGCVRQPIRQGKRGLGSGHRVHTEFLSRTNGPPTTRRWFTCWRKLTS